ncbi:hypothetical protein ACE1CD_18200 [Aerosakkonema sp. BLCC-F183]|uniref:hypothetical protein n=1 Tax=Aerosakkonema sp. BLCC-F183 TaxID=3342834 RepID=UPI0035B786CE
MTKVTQEEIAHFRSQLADYPSALQALQVLEDCEGDLEDAAIALAIRSGQQPEIANSDWLGILARKCRSLICRRELRDDLLNGNFAEIVPYLATSNLCPDLLATPVMMYVMRQGANDFCHPLNPLL